MKLSTNRIITKNRRVACKHKTRKIEYKKLILMINKQTFIFFNLLHDYTKQLVELKIFNFFINDELRTKLKNIETIQSAITHFINSITSITFIFIFTTFVIMSKKKTQSTNKILNKAKLSRKNYKAFFEALKY